MSLACLLAGRKRESGVWNYFLYLPDKGKSRCTVVANGSQKECGTEISGKNPTNLKTHLSTFHRKIFEEFKEDDNTRKVAKKRKIETEVCSSSKGIQTLREFVDKKGGKWASDSVEYQDKMRAILDWIVASGCPMFQLDLPEFKEIMRTCDPKFQVPGTIKFELEGMKV